MNNKPAVLICTRLKYIGFPKTFTIMPDDFSKQEENSVKEYINEAMESVSELCSTHLQSQVVLVNDHHIILGVVAFLRDLADDGWQGKDKGTRLIYGFFGYVWKRKEFDLQYNFPESVCFTDLLNKWIRPHWEDSPYGKWAEMPHISNYDSVVCFSNSKEAIAGYKPDSFRGKTVIVPSNEEEQLVRWGMMQLTHTNNLSLCTNVLVFSDQEFSTDFQYVSKIANGSCVKQQKNEMNLATQEKTAVKKKQENPKEKVTETDIVQETKKEKENSTDTVWASKDDTEKIDFDKSFVSERQRANKSEEINNNNRSSILMFLMISVISILSAILITVLFITGHRLPAIILIPILLTVIIVLVIWTIHSRRNSKISNQVSSSVLPESYNKTQIIHDDNTKDDSVDNIVPPAVNKKTNTEPEKNNEKRVALNKHANVQKDDAKTARKEDPFGDIFSSDIEDTSSSIEQDNRRVQNDKKPQKYTNSILNSNKETTDDVFKF